MVPELKKREEKGIYVLDAPEVLYPALLIQCGYITNKKDLAFISNTSNQEKIATDILKAIERFAKEEQTAFNSIPVNDNNAVAAANPLTISFTAEKAGLQTLLSLLFLKRLK
ncbi:MAG: N-acetylmuramoyl-L-alanine amidase [Agriterribacter sp.]